MLKGKHIILGITGSIAAYKAAYLLRLLIKRGAEVQVVMTPSGKEFITPVTLSSLSGKPVVSEFFTANTGEWHSHVDLGLWADALLIAPATAATIGKMANGIADNMLVTTYLSCKAPVFVAPAMDLDMYAHASTQRNLDMLRSYGNHIIEPATGELASHLTGKGRMEDPEKIVEILDRFFETSKSLSGKKVLMTAGPTFEPFDPVRGITNGSSGRQAAAIAAAAVRAGAEVTIVSGPVAVPYPDKAAVIPVQQAQEMFEAVKKELAEHTPDAFIGVAAVGDWRPAEYSESKLKKEKDQDTLTIKLVKNPDILSYVGHSGICSVVIGFAAETDNLAENARKKLDCKAADMIVVNPASAIGSAQNQASFVTKDGIVVKGRSSKAELAEEIIETLADLLKKKEIETYETSN